MDQAFLDIAASAHEACSEMDFSDNNWKPEDGHYSVALTEVPSGSKAAKDGTPAAWLRPTFTILDGDLEGKTFTDFIYIKKDPGKLEMGMQTLLRLASCLAEKETKDPSEAAAILEQGAGEACLEIEVYRKVAKNGNTYTNIRYLSLIAAA